MSPEELGRIQEAAIRDVVRLQEEIGLRSLRRRVQSRILAARFLLKLDNVTLVPLQGSPCAASHRGRRDRTGRRPRSRSPASSGGRTASSWMISGSSRPSRNKTPKVTLPSPTVLHFRGGRKAVDAKAYPDIAEFYSDLAGVYRAEIDDLGGRGLPLSADRRGQLRLSVRRQPAQGGGGLRRGPGCAARDLRQAAQRRDCRPAQGHDRRHASVPRQLRRRLGRRKAATSRSRRCCSTHRHHAYFLEYDSPRAGSFEPLRFLPNDKSVVLGLLPPRAPSSKPRTCSSAASTRHAGSSRSSLCVEPAVRFLKRHRRPDHDAGRPDQEVATCRRDRPRGVGVRCQTLRGSDHPHCTTLMLVLDKIKLRWS